MPTRYEILALWLMILMGSALILGPKAYLDPVLRMTYIGFSLLTIVCIVTWIGLSKIMKR
jgi:hypothetical protein